MAIGSIYAALLLIRLAFVKQSNNSLTESFEFYFHGAVALIGYIDAILLEVAKYVLWPFEGDQNYISESVKIRRRQIKDNFMGNISSYEKGRQRCLGGAYDIWWLRMILPKFSIPEKFVADGKVYSIELWLGTHDEKLCGICESMKQISVDGETIRHIEVIREEELEHIQYWKKVDGFAQQEMSRRKSQEKGAMPTVQRLDESVRWIETELRRHYAV